MILAKSNWKTIRETIRETTFEVAVLPWGATEAHNLHLPYATDNYQAERIAIDSANAAVERGASVVVLPTIPFGVNTQQLDIPLTINMNPSTQAAVLADVVDSLRGNVNKLVIANGHGGNNFRQMIRELQLTTPIFLCAVDWFKMVPPQGYFDDAGDHAGEMETSVMMHIKPDLVRPLSEAGNGIARRWKIRALQEGSAWAPRKWTQVTQDTGVGDPAAATGEKGARYLEAVCSEFTEFLVELDATPSDAMYESAPTDR